MAKALVVFGAGFSVKGGIYHRAIERLESSLKLQNTFDFIVLCGGPTWNGKSEAQAMKEWLIKRGVNPDKIIKEEKCKDTIGNVIYAKRLLLNKRVNEVLIVSSALHIPRIKKICKAVMEEDLWISFEPVPERFSEGELKLQKEHESKGEESYKKILSGVERGDDKTAEKKLFEHHPFYSKENRNIFDIKELWKIRKEANI